ncbi:MAG: hypothetical protein IJV15_01425 [Lachnospiraceae bacterium]|nr:hypothetical protein [Lachnospiraceae bacterium]
MYRLIYNRTRGIFRQGAFS